MPSFNFSNNLCLSHNSGADLTSFCNGTPCDTIAVCSCIDPNPEREALMTLYDATDGPNWTDNTGWGSDCYYCNWFGILCNPQNKVESITLNNNGLKNSFPSGIIPDLPHIRDLVLQDNQLTGQLPADLASQDSIEVINFENNLLSGSPPISVTSLTNLQELNFINNNFSGCIPQEYDSLCGITVVLFQLNPCLSHNGDFGSFCNNDPCILPNDPACKQGIGERGTFSITPLNSIQTITLINNYFDPVIIAGPIDHANSEDALIRISNVQSNSFDIKIQDWDCGSTGVDLLSGSYMVLESGTYTLPNGNKLFAANTDISDANDVEVYFPPEFSGTPIMFSQVISENQTDAVTIQTTLNTDSDPFYNLELVESKVADSLHGFENLSIVVVEEGNNTLGSDLFEFTNSTNIPGGATSVSSSVATLNFSQTYTTPIFIGKMTSTNELEPSVLRTTAISANSVDLFVDEDDNCNSANADHVSEEVHFVIFDSLGIIQGDALFSDLNVISISTIETNITAGTQLTATLDIDNIGDISVNNSFALEIYLSDGQGSVIPVSAFPLDGYLISSPSTLDITAHIPYDVSGTYVLTAFIDSQEDVDESDETNNTASSSSITITADPCTGQCGGVCENVCPADLVWPGACQVQLEAHNFDRPIDTILEVGSTAGIPNVSASGAATYTIPIVLPPATAGMAPSIALTYSSSASNGIAGYGWSISGLPMITRIPRNIYFDTVPGPVTLTSSDAFAIDGQRMQVINGEDYGDPTAIYATEMDNFSRITPQGSAGTGPDGFIVEIKNGIVHEFIQNQPDRLESSDGTVIYWCLSKTIDQYGNYVEYKYKLENDELFIDTILFTGNDTSDPTLTPYNIVTFSYIERGDKNESYVVNKRIRKSKLLTKIEIFSQSQLVRRYDLCHAEGPITATHASLRTYLQEVQETGADGITKFNPVRFLYGERFPSSSAINIQAQKEVGGVSIYEDIVRVNDEDYVRTGDFNGDGLDDIAIFRAEEDSGIEVAFEVEIYLKESVQSDNFRYIGSEDLERYQKLAKKKNNFWSIAAIVITAIAAILISIFAPPLTFASAKLFFEYLGVQLIASLLTQLVISALMLKIN